MAPWIRSEGGEIMRRIATTVIGAALLLGATSALAASADDPQDTPKGLAVSTFKAFDLSDGKGSFYWQIDSYGSASVDYVAYMFGDPNATPPRPLLCLVRSTNPQRPFRAYVHVAATNTRVVCGLPARDLHMTKSVRWRLAGRLHGAIDRAPDRGWYGG
jgi:hypothetical protein